MVRNHLKNIFQASDLEAISSAVSESEQMTSGEIRVSIRQRRSRRERGHEIERIARREFHSLGMAKTKDRTGVLLFLLLEDRQLYILADEGVHSKVGQESWERIAEEMSRHFSEKRFRDGVIHGVRSVGKVLSTHFPRQKDDRNELPDQVRVE